jgi:hypothetical protein
VSAFADSKRGNGRLKRFGLVTTTSLSQVSGERFFRKNEFRYDVAQDAYVCPGRHEPKPIRQGRLRDMRKVDYANARACRDCPLRPRCTNNYRAVSRLENEDALERMAAMLGQRPDILARRREIVEHPFGTIKQWMNQGAFLMRGPRQGPRRVQLRARIGERIACNHRQAEHVIEFAIGRKPLPDNRELAENLRNAEEHPARLPLRIKIITMVPNRATGKEGRCCPATMMVAPITSAGR